MTAQKARNDPGSAARRDDPSATEEDRRRLAAAELKKAIHEAVSSWPPLTPAQRERLALLLHPGAGNGS